ncbi:undecaprenyl-diphosphatase [Geobacter sp. AOG1]|uniref:undecaprenyl-diphosphatase n=1 Tax=Geobacter sp. AOG1 TaxID=1566346 RepID=UPI001CC5D447|nr:undecaprenyl-diphosphatase [Geobacter sp. AOG1]GFE57656.1 undecaprenyl-diphosphatase BcrC [Geobacter sp. AOG1]
MNHALFTFINGYAGKNVIVDTAAVALAEYLPLIFIAFLGYLWFFRKESREEVLMTCVAALFALTMNVAIGLLYFHPRPFMDHPVNQLIAHAAETSFPSDHATFMLALSLMLAICRRTRTAGLLFVVLSFAGGFARVFCGVHYPLDIAGSFLVALLASGLVRSLHSRLSSCSQAVLGKYDIIAAKLVIARRQ